MVFSTTNLFKGIQCPSGEACALTNCMFAHDLRPQTTKISHESASQSDSVHPAPKNDSSEPPTKRRRVTYDKAEDAPPSKADLIRSELAQTKAAAKTAPSPSGTHKPQAPPPSLNRPVSPPAKTNTKATSPAAIDANNHNHASSTTKAPATNGMPPQKLTLNPRLIPNDPAGHAKRHLYLKHLHAEM
ncbi:RNA exonuclease 3, partial [Teratosphaeriaceae sp. CCFEE 6253]